MKKTMAFLLAIITLFLLSAPAFATSNSTWDTVTADDKVVIIVPKEERDRQFNEAMDKIIQELEGTAETMDNKERFRYEYLDYEYETLGGYAGNQVPGGYRFPTGGGFYFSDSGGPSVSGGVSFSLPEPYNWISISVNLGQRSTSSGVFVEVPNTKDYFKLYVEKVMEIRPIVIYKQNKHTREYEFDSLYAPAFTYSVTQYAKKV